MRLYHGRWPKNPIHVAVQIFTSQRESKTVTSRRLSLQGLCGFGIVWYKLLYDRFAFLSFCRYQLSRTQECQECSIARPWNTGKFAAYFEIEQGSFNKRQDGSLNVREGVR